MALTNCIECKKLVSDKANFCPHCGHPTGGQKEIKIERTSKTLKAVILLSLFFLMAGLVGISRAEELFSPFSIVSTYVFLFSFIVLVVTLIIRWWRHG